MSRSRLVELFPEHPTLTYAPENDIEIYMGIPPSPVKAPKRDQVNLVREEDPAYFETELTADMFADEKSLAWIQRNTPMRRPGHIYELDGAQRRRYHAAGAGSRGRLEPDRGHDEPTAQRAGEDLLRGVRRGRR